MQILSLIGAEYVPVPVRGTGISLFGSWPTAHDLSKPYDSAQHDRQRYCTAVHYVRVLRLLYCRRPVIEYHYKVRYVPIAKSPLFAPRPSCSREEARSRSDPLNIEASRFGIIVGNITITVVILTIIIAPGRERSSPWFDLC